MDTPILAQSNGLNPTENTSYTLNCSIATSNPNPVTRYVWFQNNMKIENESATVSFSSVKRENSGSWMCGGIINQSGILIEKNSTGIQVNVFCKWLSSAKYFIPGATLCWRVWVLELMLIRSSVHSLSIWTLGNSL